MRAHRFAHLLLLPLTLACDTEPLLEPPAADGGPHAAALADRGEGVFTFEAVHYFDCVGEDVFNSFSVPYSWHLVQTPTGDFVYAEHWDSKGMEGVLVGLTSGTVWERELISSPFRQRSTGGGMVAWTYQGRFISDTGPDLLVHELYHGSRNAAGDLVVDHFEFSCRVLN